MNNYFQTCFYAVSKLNEKLGVDFFTNLEFYCKRIYIKAGLIDIYWYNFAA